MTPTITTDLVEAYSLCPRKAFLLMAGDAESRAARVCADDRRTGGGQQAGPQGKP